MQICRDRNNTCSIPAKKLVAEFQVVSRSPPLFSKCAC
jgi:hypothetical protein